MRFHSFQNDGRRRVKTEKISSLPKIISKDRRSLSKSEKKEKFPAGPTLASPGPRLVMQAMEAEKEVIRSCPEIEIINPKIAVVVK